MNDVYLTGSQRISARSLSIGHHNNRFSYALMPTTAIPRKTKKIVLCIDLSPCVNQIPGDNTFSSHNYVDDAHIRCHENHAKESKLDRELTERLILELPVRSFTNHAMMASQKFDTLPKRIGALHDKEVVLVAKKMRNAMIRSGFIANAKLDLILEEFKQKIAELMLTPTESVKVTSPILPWSKVRVIMDYIRAKIEKTITLEELAELVNLSLFYFTRAFKNTTGTSPHQLIIQRRLTKAKELLVYSNESICDIAFGTGFSSQSHLNYRMTQDLGISPKKYRDLMKTSH